MLKRVVSRLAKGNKKYLRLYLKVCSPSGRQYAEMLKRHKVFYSMGEECSVNAETYIGDASYIRLGDNVRLAGCKLFAHDGVPNMLRRAYGVSVDAVGKIDIGSNVFIGHDAIVLRNVTIGDNCVVAAGAVVARDVPPGSVVGGVPAKFICATEELLDRLKKETASLPWNETIASRMNHYDPAKELDLHSQRIRHFFGGADSKADSNSPG